ncbi:hypothetical protein GCM10022631_11660 [Deinococcus rubellus]|uniref:Phage tail protein n=1 Tax=Deinococcus rubellus TaxID=1889240 RepID=A0ABY5YCK5_9DEIO|nr:hypothetical protein [Deinococcus rubellus]UWX62789.1 hypothetical protein N0D28_08380 [Deinococcus rubellus]
MIDRVFLDEQGRDLLNLHRWTPEQALFVKGETQPDLVPIGTFEDVPGTGLKVFVGERRPRAGQFAVTLGTHGKNPEEAFALQREIATLAPRIAGYSRTPGGTLSIAGVSKVTRSFTGAAMRGGAVELTLECASPYFWQESKTRTVPVGVVTPVSIGGQARADLRVSITAGGSAVTDPSILSDAGLTTWHSTIPAGQTLMLGGEDVTLSGMDAALTVTGPLPYLEPGFASLTIIAAGATAVIAWKEGEL